MERRRWLLREAWRDSENACVLMGARARLGDGANFYVLRNPYAYQMVSLKMPVRGNYTWDAWINEMKWLLAEGVRIEIWLWDGPYRGVEDDFVRLSAGEIKDLESLRARHPKLVLKHDSPLIDEKGK